MELRIANQKDHAAIDTLVLAAFEAPEEAGLVKALRGKGEIIYEWVALSGDKITGHLVLSRMEAPPNTLALAPVSVTPEAQNQGIGSALINAALAQAKADGWVCAVVLGDPAYYGRFGFDVAVAQDFKTPYPVEYTGIAVFKPDQFAKLPRALNYPATFDGI